MTVLPVAGLGVCVMTVLMAANAAVAGDWSLESVISEKLDFNDNYGLDPESPGFVLGSVTNVTGDLIYLTPDSRFDLIGNLVGRYYTGPGDGSISDVILPRLEAKYNKHGKRTDIDLNAYYALQRFTANEALDVNSTSGETIQHVVRANASVMRKLDNRNSLTFTNSAVRTIYDGVGTDNLSLDSGLAWNRRLTKRTDGTLSFGANWLALENDTDTDKFVYRANASVSTQLSSRSVFYVGAGVNFVDTHKTDPGASRQSDLTNGFTGNIGWDYQLKTTKISLSADYGLQQGTLGDLQNRANARASIDHQINELSSVSLAITGQFIQSESPQETDLAGTGSGGGSILGFNVSPSYRRVLTDEWSMSAGYKFSLKDTNEGIGVSNNVFVSLTKDFVVIP